MAAAAAMEVIKQVVGTDWVRMTPLIQRIKMRPAFGDYNATVQAFKFAAMMGLIEIEHKRERKNGPRTRYVRIKQ